MVSREEIKKPETPPNNVTHATAFSEINVEAKRAPDGQTEHEVERLKRIEDEALAEKERFEAQEA